ncbi:hypothetical protein NIES4102_17390 [Chondrocystis sp. NIES-4102]|nr:hypothetical protein NIES4102_17390 [Chondrocystis sp. NIES-4102]
MMEIDNLGLRSLNISWFGWHNHNERKYFEWRAFTFEIN